MPHITEEDRDKTSPVWDMSQERVLVETILNQRFNFFLVFLAGAVNAKNSQQLSLILWLGSGLSVLLALVLLRAHQKLSTILGKLATDETHPFRIVDEEHSKAFAARHVISIVIPWICTALLIGGALAAATGRVRPAQQVQSPDLLSLTTASLAKELEASSERERRELLRIEQDLTAIRTALAELRTWQAANERPNNQLQRTRPAQALEPRR
jgi:hypothetical protein